MWRAKTLLFGLAILSAVAGCQAADVRTIVFYDFAQLDESAPDQHYQQFADVNGGVVDFGCFVVQRRQTNCDDNAGNGQPNLYLGVVECECPCVEQVPDPCDANRPMVRAGTVRGIVDQLNGPLVQGGVEIPIDIDLSEASDVFITIEPNDDPSPQPSSDILLQGKVYPDGAVVHGDLDSPTTSSVTGRVTLVPVQDEVSL